MDRTLYTARAQRDGNWWTISVAGLPGALTQVRRLDQAEAMTREVIALVLDVPEDSFDVQVVPDLTEPQRVCHGRARSSQSQLRRRCRSSDRAPAECGVSPRSGRGPHSQRRRCPSGRLLPARLPANPRSPGPPFHGGQEVGRCQVRARLAGTAVVPSSRRRDPPERLERDGDDAEARRGSPGRFIAEPRRCRQMIYDKQMQATMDHDSPNPMSPSDNGVSTSPRCRVITVRAAEKAETWPVMVSRKDSFSSE